MESLYYPMLTYLLWGLIWFFVSLLVMVFLFGLAGREVLKSGKKMAVWFVISLALPLTLGQVTQRTQSIIQAKNHPRLILGETVRVGDHILVNLTTDNPAIVYLEALDITHTKLIPVMATSDLEMRTEHSFLISSHLLDHKPQVNINGVRQPLDITLSKE